MVGVKFKLHIAIRLLIIASNINVSFGQGENPIEMLLVTQQN
jgi:hypothetical protein